MKYLTDLQHRFGFTRNEVILILFLSLSLMAGSGIRWLRSSERAPGATRPVFDYTRSDSEFIARSTAPLAESPQDHPATTRSLHPKKDTPALASIDINAATQQELAQLPGIGPAIAGRIVAYRSQSGPFTSIDGLRSVHGIGLAKLEKIRPFVRVARALTN